MIATVVKKPRRLISGAQTAIVKSNSGRYAVLFPASGNHVVKVGDIVIADWDVTSRIYVVASHSAGRRP